MSEVDKSTNEYERIPKKNIHQDLTADGTYLIEFCLFVCLLTTRRYSNAERNVKNINMSKIV